MDRYLFMHWTLNNADEAVSKQLVHWKPCCWPSLVCCSGFGGSRAVPEQHTYRGEDFQVWVSPKMSSTHSLLQKIDSRTNQESRVLWLVRNPREADTPLALWCFSFSIGSTGFVISTFFCVSGSIVSLAIFCRTVEHSYGLCKGTHDGLEGLNNELRGSHFFLSHSARGARGRERQQAGFPQQRYREARAGED